jgi:Kef-type K+ transport system membrane component KefB
MFTNLLIVVAAGLLAPLALGFFPRVRLPAIVLEIVLGIVIGPAGLGWVKPDPPVSILALVGLAFLLFLSGLEIDVERLRGRIVRLTALGFAVSFAIAILIGIGLGAGGFGSIILLSLFFSGKSSTSTAGRLILLGIFGLVVVLVGFAIASAERSGSLSRVLRRLQDTTAQIRVRAAFLLLIGFTALAESVGLETILGAFAAGALLALLDRDEMTTHPQFRLKLEAVGFGVFIPVFFLQATSLPFIVAATQIGLQLGIVSRASAAGLVAAGLLSVVISPALGLVLLRRERPEPADPRALPTPVMPVLAAEDSALARPGNAGPAA